MRLQKYMAHCGVGSRRKCEKIIEQGRVCQNGKKVDRMGEMVDPEKDRIAVDGKRIQMPLEARVYILLNKSRGTISSVHDQFNRETVLDQIGWKGARIYPI